MKSISIVLSGEAGQGLQTIEEFLVEALNKSFYVFSAKDVMSRVRGGNNTVEIRVADAPIYAYQEKIDMLFLLNEHARDRLDRRIDDNTTIFAEEGAISADFLAVRKVNQVILPIRELAKEAGSALMANTLLFGFIAGMAGLDQAFCKGLVTKKFGARAEAILNNNTKAFSLGYEKGTSYQTFFGVQAVENLPDFKIFDGTKAIGLGALAGGVNFLSAYPMSPGTGVMTYLVSKAEEFGVLVEQAEDEIAAINMAIGAWYAGARGLTTTSGGGFALMEEAISLSGVTETPVVVHIGMRPGPGTGLPTRTEQADLNLAVYAGHGEFPRIVLAPGNLEDAILLSQQAFYLADKYQVPVILLSDQFLLESLGQLRHLTLSGDALESFVVSTDSDYKRYAITESGVSKRGVPGYGEGLVKVDSDEHDEEGQITESFEVRVLMHEKRLRKREALLADYIKPELIGAKDYTKLIVGWGSTYGVLKEFVLAHEDQKLAFLNIKQVFPLAEELKSYFDQAESVVVVENNATGQLANILKLELSVPVHHRILKYDGEPYSIEEMERRLKEVVL
ncbi:MAG: 2-oxoglutarate/2-oxoacid ferredoxin oxidoreductase subunit alpha [Clostridiales bacterium]|nr:2-oxoglutarate/2-oxoacid ferredoxin oxidoreductase subunit alpha [Clostridiales bacterium]